MERGQLIQTLLRHFIKALFESLKPFHTIEERVDYLETLIKLLNGHYNDPGPLLEFIDDYQPFDSNSFIRTNILLKYKDKAKPFVETKLRYYFEKDPDLRSHLFTLMKINEPVLNDTEFDDYLNYIHNILHHLIEKICVYGYDEAKKQAEGNTKTLSEGDEDLIKGFKSTSKEYTRSRQILLYYFVLKLMGKSRIDTPLIKLAQFGHVLFAWPTDDPNNNTVYRMLKDAPALKKNKKATLDDLEFIKKQFELINHTEGMALVDKEIRSVKGSA